MPPRRSVHRKPPTRHRLNRKPHLDHLEHDELPHHVVEEPVSSDWVLPRILTPEEKRELIYAHVTTRKANQKNQTWGVGYYVAIAVSCLMVVTGWLLTIDKNIRQNVTDQPISNQEIVDKLDAKTQPIQQDWQIVQQQFNQILKKVAE